MGISRKYVLRPWLLEVDVTNARYRVELASENRKSKKNPRKETVREETVPEETVPESLGHTRMIGKRELLRNGIRTGAQVGEYLSRSGNKHRRVSGNTLQKVSRMRNRK